MSVYYRPGLQGWRGRGRRGFRGFGAALDYGMAASGASFSTASGGGAIPVASVVPGALVPERDSYAEFTGTHRAPAATGAAPAAFTAAFTSAFHATQQQLQDPMQSMIKSGAIQLQTWASYEASCRAAGGTPKTQADGSMTCEGASSTAMMAGAGGAKTVLGGSSSMFGSGGGGGGSGGGSGSGSAVASAFESACKGYGGTYYATGPCCALPAGMLGADNKPVAAIGLDASGNPVAVASCGGAGGGAGVAVAAGAGLLALLFLLK